MTNRVLVMGGSEFISASVARYLLEQGYVVDIFTRGLREVKYSGINRHFKGDRKKAEDLAALSGEEYDYVYDITAYTAEDVKLLTAHLSRAKLKRYLLCSSAAVYLASDEPCREDSPKGQNNNWARYGLDKLEAEDYLFKLKAEEGLPVTTFRPPYIYGPGNNLYREAYLFERISNEQPLPLPHGSRKRVNFIYIADLVRIVEAAARSERANGEAYNIAYPAEISWTELARSAAQVVGKEPQLKMVTPAILKESGLNERQFFPFRDVNLLLSIDKLRDHELPLPLVDLKEGLKLAYSWYKETKPELSDGRMTEIETVLSQLP